METQVVTALIAALTGSFVGALVTAIMSHKIARMNLDAQERFRKDEHAHQERLRAQENVEWHKRQLFEKKLRAVQEAKVWLSKLNEAINLAQLGEPSSEANQTLLTFAREARNWYNSNVLYFHDGFPTSSSFIGLTNAAASYAASTNEGNQVQRFVWDNYIETDKYVRERAEFLLRSLGQIS